MIQKPASFRSALAFIVSGMVLGVLCMVMQLDLPPQSFPKRVFAVMNWPVDRAIAFIAWWFFEGNTDQFMFQGVLMWGMYWLMLRAAFGFAGYKACRHLARNNSND